MRPLQSFGASLASDLEVVASSNAPLSALLREMGEEAARKSFDFVSRLSDVERMAASLGRAQLSSLPQTSRQAIKAGAVGGVVGGAGVGAGVLAGEPVVEAAVDPLRRGENSLVDAMNFVLRAWKRIKTVEGTFGDKDLAAEDETKPWIHPKVENSLRSCVFSAAKGMGVALGMVVGTREWRSASSRAKNRHLLLLLSFCRVYFRFAQLAQPLLLGRGPLSPKLAPLRGEDRFGAALQIRARLVLTLGEIRLVLEDSSLAVPNVYRAMRLEEEVSAWLASTEAVAKLEAGVRRAERLDEA